MRGERHKARYSLRPQRLQGDEPALRSAGRGVRVASACFLCGGRDFFFVFPDERGLLSSLSFFSPLAITPSEFQTNRRMSPLRAWLCAHASSSLAKFQHLEVTGFREPIIFQAETPLRKFVAYIDPEDKFAIEDKLSQVGTAGRAEAAARGSAAVSLHPRGRLSCCRSTRCSSSRTSRRTAS